MNFRHARALLLLAASATSVAAMAHTGMESHGHSAAGSFLESALFSGLMHPLTGLDHMAVMVCVGLWSAMSARKPGPELVWGPLAFANVLLVGSALGLQGLGAVAVEPMIAASVLIMGLLVAARQRMPSGAAALLCGVFALFHGLAHGLELQSSASAFQALAGMLIATVALHGTGLAIGWALRSRSVWVPRTLGAGVATLGGALLLQLG